jgi:hypothetical protein
MTNTIEHYDRGMTDTVELINIMKWQYGFNSKTEEFNCIKEITNHKGNWSIIFNSKPSIDLMMTIILIFNTTLSYDGLDVLKLKEITIKEIAGCLALNDKIKIIEAIKMCK